MQDRLTRRKLFLRAAQVAAAAGPVFQAAGQNANGRFQPTWESLGLYRTPDWFRDAKFGIFMHWGIDSVPAANGWYGNRMYLPEGTISGNVYQHHLKHYGHPSVFGYKDLIPLWKAEKWDPDALVGLYKQIGARYIVPVAVHHDGFDNYDSTHQPWNSVNMGPKQDIIGKWKTAAEKQGLRFGCSSHSSYNWTYLEPSRHSDKSGPLKGVPYDGALTREDGKGKWWEGYDPRQLYSRPHADGARPDEEFIRNYFDRTCELIDKYRPDLLYFDGGLSFGDNGLKLAAHFYNSNTQWHGGELEAVLNIKSMGVPSAATLDIERGQSDRILPYPWQAETSIHPGWFYLERRYLDEYLEEQPLSAKTLIHKLIDVVSKNGNFLLNVALRADGTLPEDQEEILREIGDWLKVNGEAIYGSRPWDTYGEGPTVVQYGGMKEPRRPFTPQDTRFTTKGNVLYAIVTGWGWPDDELVIKSLNSTKRLPFEKISTISVLGGGQLLKWSRDDTALRIQAPPQRPCEHAAVMKIAGI